MQRFFGVLIMTANRYFCAVVQVVVALIVAGVCACSRERNVSIAVADDSLASVDDYHADNDIAMTVRSIVDALTVGEPLDTLEYNFEGVLTDGEGHPLYTDIQGSPGLWEVDVINPSSAVIRNVYLGDLLPDDLETYLASSLSLSPANLVESEEYDDDEDTSLVVYDLQRLELRIETRAAVAPNGLEGPLITIRLSGK